LLPHVTHELDNLSGKSLQQQGVSTIWDFFDYWCIQNTIRTRNSQKHTTKPHEVKEMQAHYQQKTISGVKAISKGMDVCIQPTWG